jgi:hypothetical protein
MIDKSETENRLFLFLEIFGPHPTMENGKWKMANINFILRR